MRRLFLSALALSLLPGRAAEADLVELPSRSITCVIERETADYYHIRTKQGRTKIPKAAVVRVQRANGAANERLLTEWDRDAGTPTAAQATQPTQRRSGASGRVIKASDGNFRNIVLEAKHPVLVDFYATWCGPCKVQAPIVSALASEYRGKVRFVKVDTDRSPRVSREYGIRSIPTLILFERGKPVRRMVGIQRATVLRRHLDKVTS